MKSIELFAGAGGLALGASLAGFTPEAVIEWDKWACDTIRENQQRQNPLVADWPVHEGDVRLFDFSGISGEIDLVAGGPPCQPFSLGGKHRASSDKRDMFPTTIDVVRKLRPKAFLVENVKGLTRATFANYLQYTLLQLTFPELTIGRKETWLEHLARLEKEKTSGKTNGLTYDLVCRVINAADYGIPQRRERVFIVGFRHDMGVRWSFPEATHAQDALLYSQYVSGEYWDRHEVILKKRPQTKIKSTARIERLRGFSQESLGKPWLTVRDALQGLPDPKNKKQSSRHYNHTFQDGARAYEGHTGSPLDLPAKTLKAGDHGVPGGENMLVMPTGEVRYFTVRESARLQTFPDTYVFHGSWTETMRQLGNAVPVALARIITASVAEKLIDAEAQKIISKLKRVA
ncbi:MULTISPECIES: DNA cytosine methyltransferase [unclassified Desulfovibrio]|uniref:DNA cytosine methyltransferase n=1 Tax=unclassified Desulfovibrio TaxID=2593640 RepID=UPI000F5DBE32|nr:MULTISPECIES: DNA cytosine methyltransferase [unclassified Desulfovibrio]RRD71947.1 DNA (cytosine-5-)-methyltransferase [Desulfovibrio sp. OH1209_COT-279]RRD88160.1 DNA (cytosine-5-)-methyltransferase [Desulfovibrio sp. OH1186_COT-070]